MVKTDYEKAFAVAQQELEACLKQQQELDRRILDLRQTLASLSRLMAGDDIEPGLMAGPMIDNLRLTNEVRNIFRGNYGRVLNAQDVSDNLKELGYDLNRYQSPLATIGVVINRLKEKNILVHGTDEMGKKGFTIRPGAYLLLAKRDREEKAAQAKRSDKK